MAEAEERIKLCIHGDKGLKDFLEDHAPGLKVDIYNDRIELVGSVHNREKAQKMFRELSLDPYRTNLILSETEPLRYLNIKVENEVCYLVKDDKKVYACIPHNRGKQTKETLEKVNNFISKNILVHEFDKISDDLNTEIVDLMVNHHSKITLLEDSVLVYTADIKKYVDDVIAGHSTGQHSDNNTRQHVYEIPIDKGGKLFIERHCPGVRVHPSDTGFSLHGKCLRTEKKMIEIVDLDVDNRKRALITAEQKARDFLNKELASNRILCYILVPTSLVGIMIPGGQYDVGRIKSVIENNVCVETVHEEDSEMLIEFAGKATCLVEEDETFLVYTRDIADKVFSYLHKPDRSAQEVDEGHRTLNRPLEVSGTNKMDRINDDVHTDGNMRSRREDDEPNLVELDKNSKEDLNGAYANIGTKHTSAQDEDEQRVFYDNEKYFISGSFEHLECEDIYLETDLANYIFTYRQSDIKKIKDDYSCSIDIQNNTVSISGGSSLGRKTVDKVTQKIYKMAKSVQMDSSYLEEEDFKATQTGGFDDLSDKLKRERTQVQVYRCKEASTENTFMYKGVEVQLVHGSAADVKHMDAILCPLDGKLNPVCASAHHIMVKGGEPLRRACKRVADKNKQLSDFQLHYIPDEGKRFYAMVVQNGHVETKPVEDILHRKLSHLFAALTQNHCKSIAIPLEFMQLPAYVVARACCTALKHFLEEKRSSVLKKFVLCFVNKSLLTSLVELLRSHFTEQNPRHERGSATMFQQVIYEPVTVTVALKTTSLECQMVDAIVVPVNGRLDLMQGAVSRSVREAAGPSIQADLKTVKPQGMGPMEVTHTKAGSLPMKHILYSTLPEFKDKAYGPPAKRIGIVMEKIFTRIKGLNITSVALPALGTGGLKYPNDIVAMEMMRSIYIHAARSGVKTVNIVIYKAKSEQQRIFENALKVYMDTIDTTCKALKTSPFFVDVSDSSGPVSCKVLDTLGETRMADVLIHHRKTGVYEENDDNPCDGVCVRELHPLSLGFWRSRIFLDLSYVDGNITKAESIYKKALECAILDRHSEFMVIDLQACKTEEIKIIIDSLLKLVDKMVKADTRLIKLNILVSPEGLKYCKRCAIESQQQKGKIEKPLLSKFADFVRNTREFDWQVMEYKVPCSNGGNLIVLTDSENRLQSALMEIKTKLQQCRNVMVGEHAEMKDRDQDADGSRDHAGNVVKGRHDDNKKFAHQILQRSNSRSEDNYAEIRDVSGENREKQQRKPENRNGRNRLHSDSMSHDNDSVELYQELSAAVKDGVIRHMSLKEIDSFVACFKEPLSAIYAGEVIKVTCSYERKADLSRILERRLGQLDKDMFYIRNCTPEVHHLVQLYLKTKQFVGIELHTNMKQKQELELKIVQKAGKNPPEMIYEDVREKVKAFQLYQDDTLDVSNTTESVSDKIKEFYGTRVSKFKNILVETENDDKVIKIHYPVDEQERKLEVKNWFNVHLKIVKTTGRRNRQFGEYSSLQPGMQQAENKVKKPDKVLARIPADKSFRSMSMYDSSSQHTSRLSLAQQDNSYRPPYNASLRSHISHSTSGSYSLPVKGKGLEVKSYNSKADDEGAAGAVYCTEKNLVIKVYAGNIIHLDVDCIVNAANEDLLHGAGVAGVIASAAGLEFRSESRKYIEDNGSLDVGQCVSTGAGRLKYKFVLHAVGPQWYMYKDKDDCGHDLMKTIYNTLKRAEILKMNSVAIPSISSGIFGVPWDVCAEQYARGIERFEEESSGYLKEVHFVDINEKMLITIQSVFSVIFKVKTSQVEEHF